MLLAKSFRNCNLAFGFHPSVVKSDVLSIVISCAWSDIVIQSMPAAGHSFAAAIIGSRDSSYSGSHERATH
jgi:hypothetical protein